MPPTREENIMKPTWVLITTAVAAIGVAGGASAAPVKTQSGMLQGVEAQGVTSWKGIPYAAPPVGDLRWRAPAPAAPWQGVRQADRFGDSCMQNVTPATPGGMLSTSEDCLFLNIW